MDTTVTDRTDRQADIDSHGQTICLPHRREGDIFLFLVKYLSLIALNNKRHG